MKKSARAPRLSELLGEIHKRISAGHFEEATSQIDELVSAWPELQHLASELRDLCSKTCEVATQSEPGNGRAAHYKPEALAEVETVKPIHRRIRCVPSVTTSRERRTSHAGIEALQASTTLERSFWPEGLGDWLSDQVITGSHAICEKDLELLLDSVSYCEQLSVASLKGWCLRGLERLEAITIISRNHHVTALPTLIKTRPRPDLKARCIENGIPTERIVTAGFSLVVPVNNENQRGNPLDETDFFIVWTLRGASGQRIHHVQELSSRVEARDVGETIHAALDCLINDSLQVVSPNGLAALSDAWSNRCLHQQTKPARHEQFNGHVDNPELSIIIPIHGRDDFIDYQLNHFNYFARQLNTRGRFPYQIIYVLDDPRLEGSVAEFTSRCETLYTTPFEMVYNDINLGFAGASNRGSEHVRAPFILLMNSDVVPASYHSIHKMLASLRQHTGKVGAVGGYLTYENGAIQHVGMEFVKQPWHRGLLGNVWLNDHPGKGIKKRFSPEEMVALQEVEAATAACLMIPTALYRDVKGLSTDYIIGDFEDSDLCMKIRAEGLRVVVDLEAQFYHLERQSFGSEIPKGLSAQKLVAANAYLHHLRWSDDIEAIKQDQEHVA